MLSIIIPTRNEQFLQRTIDDLLLNAEGDIEIIAILDGYWPNPIIKDDPRVILIHRSVPYGMRPGINAGVAISKGKYILKIDAHCMVDKGFDTKLKSDCEDNWVVVPRRKRLDAENWCIQDVGKPDVDYEYLSYPNDPQDFGGAAMHGRRWDSRSIERKDKPEYMIDDLMSFQGSCWFIMKDYYHELDLMDTLNYGSFAHEAQEIGLKSWLSGGRVVVNKRTWYAHLHKGKKYGRGYSLDEGIRKQGTTYTNKWIENSAWGKQKLPFSWIIEKFWPLPEWDETKLKEIKQYDHKLLHSI